MKIGTFINHGTVIEIESVQTMNLSVDKGEVRIGGKPMEEFARDAAAVAPTDTVAGEASPETTGTPAVKCGDAGCEEHSAPASEADPEAESIDLVCPFTEAQQKSSGIKLQAGVVLALMSEMQPRFTQKVDWLSFYSVLLRRRWVDDNLRAFCRMVDHLFGIQLDPRTLSADLRTQGSPDYTLWTDADKRIARRKRLASEFDTRLTEYFESKRAEVLSGVRE